MLTTEAGAEKIYKLTEKLKFLHCSARRIGRLGSGAGRVYLTPLILAVLAGYPLQLNALPVTIGWQVPLSPAHAYQLEVSSDPGFGVTVHSAPVTGKSLAWDAPKEGVYHWRLMRVGKTGGPQEASTFVSGSFIAVDPSLGQQRSRPAKISWDPVEGADRYKLYVVDKSGKARTMLALANFFILPASDSPVMVEVVPYSGGRKTFRNYHFNPSLKWDGGVVEEPAPVTEPVAAVPVANESEAPQVARPEELPPVAEAVPQPATEPPPADPVATSPAEPDPDEAPAQAAEPVSPAVSATPAAPDEMRRRKYQLSLFGFHGQEKLRLQKLEVFFSSLQRVTGGGASLWINPASGLVVSASGWYHEHAGTVEQPSLFAGSLDVKQSRYLVEFQAGWNLLHWAAPTRHMLTVSLMAAAAQLPFLPLEFDAAGGTYPVLGKKQISMPGLAAGYSWQSSKIGLSLDAGFLQEATDEVEMGWQRLVFDYFYGERLAASVGFYNRFLQSIRCHRSSVICLKEGKVTTTSEERGVYVGIGAAFF